MGGKKGRGSILELGQQDLGSEQLVSNGKRC